MNPINSKGTKTSGGIHTGTFKFWIASKHTLCFETWCITMLVTISPIQCKGVPFAEEGPICGGSRCHSSMPGNRELVCTSNIWASIQEPGVLHIFNFSCHVQLHMFLFSGSISWRPRLFSITICIYHLPWHCCHQCKLWGSENNTLIILTHRTNLPRPFSPIMTYNAVYLIMILKFNAKMCSLLFLYVHFCF